MASLQRRTEGIDERLLSVMVRSIIYCMYTWMVMYNTYLSLSVSVVCCILSHNLLNSYHNQSIRAKQNVRFVCNSNN